MFLRPLFRFVPDNTSVHFMRARFWGLAGSFLLSTLSIGLFFYPGLNLGIDFKGGVVMEVQTTHPADMGALRAAFAADHIPIAGLQTFGGPNDLLVRLDPPAAAAGGTAGAAGLQTLEAQVRATLTRAEPGAKVLRSDVVGASVSAELFTNGMLALAISLAMIMAYIWFRFEWQFAVGAVVTLLLDVTKTIGFLVVTRIQFDLVMVAAILTIIGYSTNDKVVVYDRVRENLRKYKAMPLRDLIDLSINETLNRTLGTSCTVFLASLPLAIWGGSTLSGFAWTMLFGIAIGTVSSIMIAAPILLLLGEHRLRRDVATAPKAAVVAGR
jgi:preprotein translocase subunit SecF